MGLPWVCKELNNFTKIVEEWGEISVISPMLDMNMNFTSPIVKIETNIPLHLEKEMKISY